MVITPTGVRDGGVRTAGSGDLFLPLSEHGHTVYCDQVHYGPVPGRIAEARVKGDQVVVLEGRFGYGGGADGGLGRRMDGGG